MDELSLTPGRNFWPPRQSIDYDCDVALIAFCADYKTAPPPSRTNQSVVGGVRIDFDPTSKNRVATMYLELFVLVLTALCVYDHFRNRRHNRMYAEAGIKGPRRWPLVGNAPLMIKESPKSK